MVEPSPKLEKSPFGSIASTSAGSYRTQSTRVSWGRFSSAYQPQRFDGVLDLDLMFKEEMVVALEEELQNLWPESSFIGMTSRQNSAELQETMKELAKNCVKDPQSVSTDTAKQLKLLNELDVRLRSYRKPAPGKYRWVP
jgi:hypothetical protein